eukprot:TRINITY_DN11605_c0_g3_i1.p1 TRINITY_DN11605_c0_g3~~TRINITY_DN11605_c0_g3_i1.p1  ORF type:complete len:488 (-),score=66.85 TRINITY_DN11605_c0_g3_i1:155-1618(-)
MTASEAKSYAGAVTFMVVDDGDPSRSPWHFILRPGSGKAVKIGRADCCDVSLQNRGVSALHAEIRLLESQGGASNSGTRLLVRDLSTNGTGLQTSDGTVAKAVEKGVEEPVPHGSVIIVPFRLKASGPKDEPRAWLRVHYSSVLRNGIVGSTLPAPKRSLPAPLAKRSTSESPLKRTFPDAGGGGSNSNRAEGGTVPATPAVGSSSKSGQPLRPQSVRNSLVERCETDPYGGQASAAPVYDPEEPPVQVSKVLPRPQARGTATVTPASSSAEVMMQRCMAFAREKETERELARLKANSEKEKDKGKDKDRDRDRDKEKDRRSSQPLVDSGMRPPAVDSGMRPPAQFATSPRESDRPKELRLRPGAGDKSSGTAYLDFSISSVTNSSHASSNARNRVRLSGRSPSPPRRRSPSPRRGGSDSRDGRRSARSDMGGGGGCSSWSTSGSWGGRADHGKAGSGRSRSPRRHDGGGSCGYGASNGLSNSWRRR